MALFRHQWLSFCKTSLVCCFAKVSHHQPPSGFTNRCYHVSPSVSNSTNSIPHHHASYRPHEGPRCRFSNSTTLPARRRRSPAFHSIRPNSTSVSSGSSDPFVVLALVDEIGEKVLDEFLRSIAQRVAERPGVIAKIRCFCPRRRDTDPLPQPRDVEGVKVEWVPFNSSKALKKLIENDVNTYQHQQNFRWFCLATTTNNCNDLCNAAERLRKIGRSVLGIGPVLAGEQHEKSLVSPLENRCTIFKPFQLPQDKAVQSNLGLRPTSVAAVEPPQVAREPALDTKREGATAPVSRARVRTKSGAKPTKRHRFAALVHLDDSIPDDQFLDACRFLQQKISEHHNGTLPSVLYFGRQSAINIVAPTGLELIRIDGSNRTATAAAVGAADSQDVVTQMLSWANELVEQGYSHFCVMQSVEDLHPVAQRLQYLKAKAVVGFAPRQHLVSQKFDEACDQFYRWGQRPAHPLTPPLLSSSFAPPLPPPRSSILPPPTATAAVAEAVSSSKNPAVVSAVSGPRGCLALVDTSDLLAPSKTALEKLIGRPIDRIIYYSTIALHGEGFPTTSKKSADVKIAVDAAIFALRDKWATFCLVGVKNDLHIVATRLRSLHAHVIGVGTKAAPPRFRSACDRFFKCDHVLPSTVASSISKDSKAVGSTPQRVLELEVLIRCDLADQLRTILASLMDGVLSKKVRVVVEDPSSQETSSDGKERPNKVWKRRNSVAALSNSKEATDIPYDGCRIVAIRLYGPPSLSRYCAASASASASASPIRNLPLNPSCFRADVISTAAKEVQMATDAMKLAAKGTPFVLITAGEESYHHAMRVICDRLQQSSTATGNADGLVWPFELPMSTSSKYGIQACVVAPMAIVGNLVPSNLRRKMTPKNEFWRQLYETKQQQPHQPPLPQLSAQVKPVSYRKTQASASSSASSHAVLFDDPPRPEQIEMQMKRESVQAQVQVMARTATPQKKR